ncbi:unnamed protein product, partial [Heterosigma akashiwo]
TCGRRRCWPGPWTARTRACTPSSTSTRCPGRAAAAGAADRRARALGDQERRLGNDFVSDSEPPETTDGGDDSEGDS